MRQYLSVSEFALTPAGSVLSPQFSGTAGVLDRVLAHASAGADSICRCKLGLNGATTTTQSLAPGATSITVASTLGIDQGADAWILLDSGTVQEMLQVVGVTPNWSSPLYPGTLQLSATTPVTLNHNSGVVVQGVTQERRTARGGSTNRSTFGGPVTQESQMAEAHAPHELVSDLARIIRLANRPVQQVLQIQVVQPWTGTPYSISVSGIALNAAQGWYRLPYGTFVPQGADVITQYTAGYATVPDDVLEAVALLAADHLATAYAPTVYGLVEDKLGQRMRRVEMRGDKPHLSILRARAEEILARYVVWSL